MKKPTILQLIAKLELSPKNFTALTVLARHLFNKSNRRFIEIYESLDENAKDVVTAMLNKNTSNEDAIMLADFLKKIYGNEKGAQNVK